MLFHVSFWARVSYVTTRVTRATCLLHVLANSDCIRLESFHQTKNQFGNEPMLIISISSMHLIFSHTILYLLFVLLLHQMWIHVSKHISSNLFFFTGFIFPFNHFIKFVTLERNFSSVKNPFLSFFLYNDFDSCVHF